MTEVCVRPCTLPERTRGANERHIGLRLGLGGELELGWRRWVTGSLKSLLFKVADVCLD